MPLITKISKAPIGEFVIKFSLRHNRFEIEDPTGNEEISEKLRHKCIARNYELNSWADVENELKSIVNQYRHNFLLKRRVIIIQLKTSESVYKLNKPSHWKGTADTMEPLDHLDDVEGFELKWYVADEYEYPSSRHLFYRITDTNKNNRHRKYYLEEPRDHTNILPQLLHDDNLRVFEYTEGLYQFLQEVQGSVERMLTRMIDYFSIDPQKFLENVKQQIKLLPDGQENKTE
jgi:hypothetical protein